MDKKPHEQGKGTPTPPVSADAKSKRSDAASAVPHDAPLTGKAREDQTKANAKSFFSKPDQKPS
ncbi:MAG: hypothetical protein ACHQRK_07025 [Gemmatimonadales bacterium]|jgi:hypothetical protein